MINNLRQFYFQFTNINTVYMGCTPPKKPVNQNIENPEVSKQQIPEKKIENTLKLIPQDEFKVNEEINPIPPNKINSVAAYPSLQQPSKIQKEQANITIYQPLLIPANQTGNFPSAKLIFGQNDQKREISNQDFQKKELFIPTVPQNRIPFEQSKINKLRQEKQIREDILNYQIDVKDGITEHFPVPTFNYSTNLDHNFSLAWNNNGSKIQSVIS